MGCFVADVGVEFIGIGSGFDLLLRACLDDGSRAPSLGGSNLDGGRAVGLDGRP